MKEVPRNMWGEEGSLGEFFTQPLRRLDQIVGQSDLFSINPMACAQAGEAMAECSWGFGATDFSSIEQGLLVRLAVAAVCHQFNWDFLTQALRRELTQATDPVSLLASLDAPTFASWLADYEKPDRIRASERAALLRDVGRKLESYDSGVTHLIESSGGVLSGVGGLMEKLDSMEAFRQDPLRKKANVFVHEIVRDRLVRFEDEHTIAPAIDYHIMRIYLRSGRVIPRHRETLEVLRSNQPTRQRLITLLRESVAEALRQTAFYAGLPVPDVNYIEWQLGRGACTRTEPHCHQRTEYPDPVIQRLSEEACPFRGFCVALRDDRWLIAEPQYHGSFF